MPTDTPNLLASLDAAAELGKAATKRPWANHYIVAAANLDHAAIAAELRAKGVEIKRYRETLMEIARCAGATDACWHCRNLASAALTPTAGDAHA